MSESRCVLTFGEFYRQLRAHFSTTVADFERFQTADGLAEKVRVVLDTERTIALIKELESCRSHGVGAIDVAKKYDDGKEATVRPLSKDAKFPFLTGKAKVACSEKKGRHVVATQKILPGEVVIHEPAYATMLQPRFHNSHCLSCFRRVKQIHECSKCRAVVFCSPCCHDQGQARFHWAECGSLADLQGDPDLGPMALIAFRVVVGVAVGGTGGPAALLEAAQAVWADEGKVAKAEAVYDGRDVRATLLQEAHQDDREQGEVFRRCATAIYLCHFLHKCGFFGHNSNNNNTDSPFLSSSQSSVVLAVRVLAHVLMACSCNAYEVSELAAAAGATRDTGGAVYPTVSLTNHACFPNTLRYSDGSSCVVRALRTICVGEEITDNYGHFYPLEETANRKEALRKQYYFECSCRACTHSWPSVDVLRKSEPLLECDACHEAIPAKDFIAKHATGIGGGGGSNKSKGKGKASQQSSGQSKCPRCRRPLSAMTSCLSVAKALPEIESSARTAAKTMLPSTAEEARTGLLAALAQMERCVRQPNWTYILCQQAVAQSYSITGNYVDQEKVEEEEEQDSE